MESKLGLDRFRTDRVPREIVVILAILLGGLVTTGCVTLSSPADRFFDAGDYAAAEKAYRDILRKDPTRRGNDRALFQLALIYSQPDSELMDRERSLEVLRRLVAQHSSSPYVPQARLILDQARKVEVLEKQLEASRRVAGNSAARIQRLEKEAEALRAEIVRGEDSRRGLRSDAARRERAASQARAELEAAAERIRQLERDLRMLKEIDLERDP